MAKIICSLLVSQNVTSCGGVRPTQLIMLPYKIRTNEFGAIYINLNTKLVRIFRKFIVRIDPKYPSNSLFERTPCPQHSGSMYSLVQVFQICISQAHKQGDKNCIMTHFTGITNDFVMAFYRYLLFCQFEKWL